jgi:hypothetical protein
VINGILQGPPGGSFSGAKKNGPTAASSLPFLNATVSLYAAGIGGYGSTAILLAQTSTGSTGSFSFTNSSTYVNSFQNTSTNDVYTTASGSYSKAITSTFACPSYSFPSADGTTSITKDSLVYLVASSGTTGTIGGSVNSAAVYMLALGDCQNFSTPHITINEATTVGSVFALSPYMSPIYPSVSVNGTATTLTGGALGTSSSYLTGTGTAAQGGYTGSGANKSVAVAPLGYTGLANAFVTANNLVDDTVGFPRASFTNSATFSGSNSVTLTGTPDQAKMNTLANILASCTQGSSGCSTLFANAVPPIASATTSLGSGVTFPTATDTLQVAYYMATNPTDNTTYGATTVGSSTNLTNLYSITPPAVSYAPALTVQPSDWTVSIAYSSNSTCGGGQVLSASPWAAATDLAGNVALINGTTGALNTLVTINNAGVPTTCLLGTYTSGRSVVFDLNDNVWAAGSNASGLVEASIGASSYTTWPTTDGTATFTAYALAADGLGNIFYTIPTIPVSTSYVNSSGTTVTTSASYTSSGTEEFVGAQSASSISNSKVIGTLITSTTANAAENLYNLNSDALGNVWSTTIGPYRTNDAVLWTRSGSSYSRTNIGAGGTTSAPQTDYGTAIDASGYLAVGAASGVYKISPNTATETTTYSTTAQTGAIQAENVTAGAGGLTTGVRSNAIDGAGNVWYSNVGAESGTAPNLIYGLSEFDSTASMNPISPAGTGYAKTALGPSRGIAIDISGNVWVPSDQATNSLANGFLVEVVGAAVPVIPVTVATRDNKLATKP